MSDHIIVLFDRSGSMGDSFRAGIEQARRADFVGQHEVKIKEAQERLIAWLNKSRFETVTIIPFHSVVEHPLTASLRREQNRIIQYIRNLQPGGGTNLDNALVLALQIGTAESGDSFVRYLIVTDGLSNTRNQDLEIVTRIPKTQGVDGILIDPTGAGEEHLSRLCVRGHYISVVSAGQLGQALDIQDQTYSERLSLSQSYQKLVSSNAQSLKKLEILSPKLNDYPELNRKLQPVVSHALSEAYKTKQFREELADQNISINELVDRHKEILKNQPKMDALVDLLENCYQQPPNLKISISHPRFLSKRFASPFLIHVYPPDKRNEVEIQLRDELLEWGLKERVYDSDLIAGLTVVFKMTSPDIKFSDEVVKILQQAVNQTTFVAKPDDSCHPGTHTVKLSISDKSSGQEYESIPFQVKVVDFAFDHVSRPIISNLASFVLGIGSFATFALTLLGQIDTTLGLASGTAAGTLAAIIYTRFLNLYRRPTINQP